MAFAPTPLLGGESSRIIKSLLHACGPDRFFSTNLRLNGHMCDWFKWTHDISKILTRWTTLAKITRSSYTKNLTRLIKKEQTEYHKERLSHLDCSILANEHKHHLYVDALLGNDPKVKMECKAKLEKIASDDLDAIDKMDSMKKTRIQQSKEMLRCIMSDDVFLDGLLKVNLDDTSNDTLIPFHILFSTIIYHTLISILHKRSSNIDALTDEKKLQTDKVHTPVDEISGFICSVEDITELLLMTDSLIAQYNWVVHKDNNTQMKLHTTDESLGDQCVIRHALQSRIFLDKRLQPAFNIISWCCEEDSQLADLIAITPNGTQIVAQLLHWIEHTILSGIHVLMPFSRTPGILPPPILPPTLLLDDHLTALLSRSKVGTDSPSPTLEISKSAWLSKDDKDQSFYSELTSDTQDILNVAYQEFKVDFRIVSGTLPLCFNPTESKTLSPSMSSSITTLMLSSHESLSLRKSNIDYFYYRRDHSGRHGLFRRSHGRNGRQWKSYKTKVKR